MTVVRQGTGWRLGRIVLGLMGVAVITAQALRADPAAAARDIREAASPSQPEDRPPDPDSRMTYEVDPDYLDYAAAGNSISLDCPGSPEATAISALDATEAGGILLLWM